MEADDYFKSGIRHYEDGDYDSAIADYTKAIESNPKCVPAWCNRGLVWGKKAIFKRLLPIWTRQSA